MDSPAVRFLLLAAIVGAYLSQAALFHRYLDDDAFITFRYSRSWANGRGPYFNPGEHVEGYTNFSLMLALTPIIRVFGASSALPAAKMLGFACGAAAAVLAFDIARRQAFADPDLRPRAGLAGLLAAGLLAINPAYVVNAMSGLETALYGFSLTAGVWLDLAAASGRWRGAGLAFAAAALTRPEGAFVFAVYWLSVFVVRRVADRATQTLPPARVVDVAIVSAAVAAQLAFRILHYDGELLPNTFFAKMAGFRAYEPLSYIRDALWYGFLGAFGLLAAMAGWYRRPARFWSAAPVVVAAATGTLLPLVVGSDWMLGWRLVIPYFPLLACLVALGWVKLCSAAMPARSGWMSVCLLGTLLLLWTLQRLPRDHFFDAITLDADNWDGGYGMLVNALCRPSSSSGAIAMMDIGKVGYACFNRRILDITGLTDRFIAKRPGAFLDKQFDTSYVLERAPQYVVIRLIERPDSADHAKLVVAPYTTIEDRLYRDPRFRALYRVPRRDEPPGSERRRLAAILGTYRLFPRWGSDGRGYLALFRRQDVAD